MKVGMGLYGGMVNDDNLRFAKQIGATHIVAHLPSDTDLPSTSQGFWAYA